MTPTDQLSSSARRLLKSIRQKASGEIEVRLHDQLQAADILNRMQSVYLERSMSVTAHVTVPALKNMTADQALDFLESIKPTRPASPVTIDADVVDCANDVQTLCITPENTTP